MGFTSKDTPHRDEVGWGEGTAMQRLSWMQRWDAAEVGG